MHFHVNRPDKALQIVCGSVLSSIPEHRNRQDVRAVVPYGMQSIGSRGQTKWFKSDSRNGRVLQYYEPLMITLTKPRNRVLFNPARNCNPFLHLMECLWIISGRDDVVSISKFAKQLKEYSDDGETFNGAYGHRMRYAQGAVTPTHIDQFGLAISRLRENPDCRRQVVTMWTPDDGYYQNSKDLPCNTSFYLQVQNGHLNMMVNNRSNDIIWGMLGTNICHFSFILYYAYVLLQSTNPSIKLGRLHQVSFNPHIYLDKYPIESIVDMYEQSMEMPATPYEDKGVTHTPLLGPGQTDGQFCQEVNKLLSTLQYSRAERLGTALPTSPFILGVVEPAIHAWKSYQQKDYDAAIIAADDISQADWRIACVQWMRRAKARFVRRNPYAPMA